MTLGELAFACYIFDKIDKGKYKKFLEATKSLNLSNDKDCVTLLKFLNSYWNCRRPEASHEKAAKELKTWHKKWAEELFSKNKTLYELKQDDRELDLAATAYEELLKCKVEYVTKNDKPRSISFGPTTAAKILFFLRPKALPPWDDPIRENLVQIGSIKGHGRDSYLCYLKHCIKEVVPALREDCKKHGFELKELPRKLQKPDYITIPKLIDEYYWITITRKIVPPAREDLQCWFKWYNGERGN